MQKPRWRHESEKPEIVRQAEQCQGADPVNRLAIVLMGAWGNADPTSNVAKNPASYIATFADMARDALEHLAEGEHVLRPRPWPPIPYPDDAAHQARWTLQRVFEEVRSRTGDHNEALLAAADALIAEGWTPPQAAVPAPHTQPRQCPACGQDGSGWNPLTGAVACRGCVAAA